MKGVRLVPLHDAHDRGLGDQVDLASLVLHQEEEPGIVQQILDTDGGLEKQFATDLCVIN